MLKTRTVGVYAIQRWVQGWHGHRSGWKTWSKPNQYLYMDYETDLMTLVKDPDNILHCPHGATLRPEPAGGHYYIYPRAGQPDMRLKLINEIEVY